MCHPSPLQFRVQNHLEELWCLFNIACHGELLGDKREFSYKCGSAILKAQDRHATDAEREAGDKAMARLRGIIEPYFLRREKCANPVPVPPLSSGAMESDANGAETEGRAAPAPARGEVLGCPSRKFEMVVWTKVTPVQLALYEGFLGSEDVKEVLNTSKSPLAAIGVLKKICCHPLLLNDRARLATKIALKKRAEFMEGDGADAVLAQLDSGMSAFCAYETPSAESVQWLLSQSGKLVFLMQLLEQFEGMSLLLPAAPF